MRTAKVDRLHRIMILFLATVIVTCQLQLLPMTAKAVENPVADETTGESDPPEILNQEGQALPDLIDSAAEPETLTETEDDNALPEGGDEIPEDIADEPAEGSSDVPEDQNPGNPQEQQEQEPEVLQEQQDPQNPQEQLEQHLEDPQEQQDPQNPQEQKVPEAPPEQPGETQPEAEQPEAEQPQTEQPEAEQPQTEQPEAEQPETEQPGGEQADPAADPPKDGADSAAEADKTEDAEKKDVENLLRAPLSAAPLLGAPRDAGDPVTTWEELKGAIDDGETDIILGADFPAEGTISIGGNRSIVIKPQVGQKYTIYSKAGGNAADGRYDSMFKVGPGGSLTIENGVTLSGKTDLSAPAQGCPDNTVYTQESFSGYLVNGTYVPRGFFIEVEGGTARLNGTVSDFITSRDKNTTPRYVAPVVAKGSGSVFDLGPDGVIKNNLVGYIVKDGMANNDAQTIKQYIKGAGPNIPRVPNAATQKKNASKFDGRPRSRDAGIDGGAPGTGITATAGAVIYKDGAEGTVEGTIQNNRADTGGIMASGSGTKVTIASGVIEKNVGVQFGGGSTAEQGGALIMTGGTMRKNVAWFGGGAVYATENGVDWLQGRMQDADYTPWFDKRKDGEFFMEGGTLTENTAFTRGGAVLADSDGVFIENGTLSFNMSRMLGGAMYVMGDHPKYEYTVVLRGLYVHDNAAVSGESAARSGQGQPSGLPKAPDSEILTDHWGSGWDQLNQPMQTLLSAPDPCRDAADDILSDSVTGGQGRGNTDDYMDGTGAQGTGGGVWLCAYGNTVFAANQPTQVVINNNWATGAPRLGLNAYHKNMIGSDREDAINNSQAPEGTPSHSGITGGSDFHADTGGSGMVTISGLQDAEWYDENTGLQYKSESSGGRLNLVNLDTDLKMNQPRMVEVVGNLARHGGGLAADGTFIFDEPSDQATPAAILRVQKEWTSSAKKTPVTIRVTADTAMGEAHLADIPLDGVANPATEFDTVQEFDPADSIWSGSFEFPRAAEVLDDQGNPIGETRLYTLVYTGTESPTTRDGWSVEQDMELSPHDYRGRAALGAVIANNKEADIKVLFGEPVYTDESGNPKKIRKDSNGDYLYKPITIKFSEWKEVNENGEVKLVKNDDYVFVPGEADLVNLNYEKDTTPHYKTQYNPSDGTIEYSDEVSYFFYKLTIPINAPMSNDNRPIAEKYVNKDVHDDIVNFDQEFTYDILAYVPVETTEFTISDTLPQGLEFADEEGHASTDPARIIRSITIKTSNNHKTGEEGSVSLGGEPGINGNPINLMNESASIRTPAGDRTIHFQRSVRLEDENRTLKVTIDHDDTLSIVRGKWVQLTFNARIQDKYRSLEALKALTAGVEGKTKSWEEEDTAEFNKQGSPAEKVYVSANGDLNLLAALINEVGPDPVIWAVEAPSRLFARTQSGNYYATPFNDKSGNTWRILDPNTDDADGAKGFGKSVWTNADNRYIGRAPDANNTVALIPLSGDSRLDALNAVYEIKGAVIEKAAEGASHLFALVKDAAGEEHYYATTGVDGKPDLKDGAKWTKLTNQDSEEYKNAVARLSYDRYTIRMLDTATTSTTLDPAQMKNWPVFSDEEHEGMANQGSYFVRLSDGAESSHKTNTVTVKPETCELIVKKLWSTAAGDRWPEGIDSVAFRILAVDGSGGKKAVYADADGRVTGVGTAAPDGSTEMTVTISESDAEKEKTVTDLPKLKDTSYIAEEVRINEVPVSFEDAETVAKTTIDGRDVFSSMTESARETENGTIPVFTATNSIATEEKYVENKVHADLICFDREFTYSVMGFVPSGATQVILSDELTKDLLFVEEDASKVLTSVVAYKSNDRQGTGEGTVSKSDGDDFIASYPGLAANERQKDLDVDQRDYKIELHEKEVKLTLKEGFLNEVRSHAKLEDREDKGFWIKMTFRAKINPESYAEVAAKIADKDDSTVTDGIRWEKVPEDGPVLNGKDVLDDGSHAGLANRAKYQVFFGNEGTSEHETNTVTVKPETQDLSVTKVWVGAAEDEILTPEEFKSYLILKAGDRDVTEEYADCLTVTRNNDGTYAAKWTGLPKLTGVTYGVDEESIPGYSKEISGTTITNTRTEEELEDLVITKVWAGAEESDIPAPEEFKNYLVLKAGKRDVTEDHADKLTVTINRDGTYRARWTGLPKLDGEKYSADEKDVPGFTKEVKGTTITNTKIREETTELTVTKIWAGAEAEEIPAPEEFKRYLILKAGGEDVTKQYADKLTVTKNGDGTYTAKWAGLPKVKGVKYTADEKDVPGFEKSVRGTTITNTKIVLTEDLVITKVWAGAPKDEILTPEEFRGYLILKAGSEDVTKQYADRLTVTKNGDGTYTAKWTGLPKAARGAKYSADEKDVPGFKKTVRGNTITNTWEEEEEPKKEDGGKKTTIRYEDEYTVHVNGSKTWIDEGHQSGLRPKAITIHLLADGVEVNRVTMTPMHNGTTNSTTWVFDFGELPMYKQGARITYTITEDPVEEYVASVSSTYDRIRTEPGGTLNFELVNKTTRNPDRLGAARGTGDESRMTQYLLLVLAASAGLAAWGIKRRRHR